MVRIFSSTWSAEVATIVNFSTPCGEKLAPFLLRHETHELFRIDGGILAELNVHGIAMAVDANHADALA